MVLTKEDAEKQQLHLPRPDNSPDFDFKTYRPLIEHKEE